MNKFIILFVLALFSSMSIKAQEINKEKLDSLFTILEDNNKTMGSAVVSKEGKTIYSNSIGYAYFKDSIKNSGKTKYRIGSITKMFTATLIFQLVDTGKVNLDDKLSGFFPEIPNSEKITIGNLLNHTSGLFSVNAAKDFNPYVALTHEQMLDKMASHKPVFEPNIKVEYSNTNFILLGYILEKKYKKPYSEILKEQITDKLGLENTYYGGKIVISNNEAAGYSFTQKWEVQAETDMSLPHGAGAIISNPKDLTIFIEALFNGKLISDSSFKQMITIRDEMGYGIGGTKFNDRMIYGYSGGIDGFNSMLIYDPTNKISVAVTANGNSHSIVQIAINLLLGSMGESFDLPSFKTIHVNEEDLNQYVGYYISADAPFDFIVKINDGKLMAGPVGDDNNILRPVKEHEFYQEQHGVTLNFKRESKQMVMSRGGKTMIFNKKEE